MRHIQISKTIFETERVLVADWKAINCKQYDEMLACNLVPLDIQLISPVFRLSKRMLYRFHVNFNFADNKQLVVALVHASNGETAPQDRWIMTAGLVGPGEIKSGFSIVVDEDDDYRLAICNAPGVPENLGAVVESFEISRTERGPISDFDSEEKHTYLPHWGAVRRFLHDRCRQSRLFNAFVASVEMRLNREEVLSVPIYMALCPTGQCNALCDFCSVTINRTGIIKKQLPWGKLTRLLDVTRNTLMMCGLEGNGEPTLYKQFDELFGLIRSGGSDVYLITNGSRLVEDQLPVVLGASSITFSLNACTPETHYRVMKLRNWPDVVHNIKAIVNGRGTNSYPSVFVSFVAYNYNIHELQEFMAFAEYELRADVIVIRPLSELGTDELGTVEDLRDIVPYESDVRDAIDAAQEYISDVPRRYYKAMLSDFKSEIWFDATAFRNVRPDPLDRVLAPRGFEGRLLVPRRGDWHAESLHFHVKWKLSQATLFCADAAAGEVLWSSAFTPVTPGEEPELKLDAALYGAALELQVIGEDGETLAALALEPAAAAGLRAYSIQVAVKHNLRVRFQLVNVHGGAFLGCFDFGRLRTPGMGIRQAFKLPFARRWAVDTPGVEAAWRENSLDIVYDGASKGYLYKSYFAPCLPNVDLELPVRITVRHGTINVGFLSEDAQRWIAQSKFGPGNIDTVLRIPSGENRRVQAVITAPEGGGLDATIDWGDALEISPVLGIARPMLDTNPSHALLPAAALLEPGPWQAIDDGMVLELGAGVVIASHTAPTVGPYLAKGPAIHAAPHTLVRLKLSLSVTSGVAVLGFMDAAQTCFIHQEILPAGQHDLSLQLELGESDRLIPILAAHTVDPLQLSMRLTDHIDVTFSGGEFIDILPVEAVAPAAPALLENQSALNVQAAALAAAPAPAVPPANWQKTPRKQPLTELWRRIESWVRYSPNQIYCPKPWTDLNNFTVDGRMDVCCITTGASQSAYALGNIETQTFQEIWNGEAIRKFRRTVNSADKLPPCARCPMAQGYNGPFFSRGHTLGEWKSYLTRFRIFRRFPKLSVAAVKVAEVILDLTHFRHMSKK